MSKAHTHRRTVEDREIRAAKKGNARDAIGTLTPGCDIYILTYGQFSLMDVLGVLTAVLIVPRPLSASRYRA